MTTRAGGGGGGRSGRTGGHRGAHGGGRRGGVPRAAQLARSLGAGHLAPRRNHDTGEAAVLRLLCCPPAQLSGPTVRGGQTRHGFASLALRGCDPGLASADGPARQAAWQPPWLRP
jgi:hypothetical protein